MTMMDDVGTAVSTAAMKTVRWVRPRTALLAVGASVSAFVMVVGLVATPFFGAGLAVWGNVFFGTLVVLIGGLFVGLRISRLTVKPDAALDLLFVLAGGLMLAVGYGSSDLCRRVLDRNLAGDFSPAACILLMLVVGAMPAIVTVPVTTAAAIPGADRKAFKVPPRLLLFPLAGALIGSFVGANVLYRLLDVPVWTLGAGAGSALVVLGATGPSRLARALAVIVVLGYGTAAAVAPREIQSTEFQEAIRVSSSERVGTYYLLTTGQRELAMTELERRWREIKEIVEEEDVGAAIESVIDLLRNLGKASVTGDGLRKILVTAIGDEETRRRFLPISEKLHAIRSDGNGRIHFSLVDPEPGEDVVRIVLPSDDGSDLEIAVKEDFYVDIMVEPDIRRTTLAFGPLAIKRAGLFERNDTYETPVLIENVVGPFDAHLVSIIFERTDAEFTIKAEAQALSLGPLVTEIVHTIPQ